MTLPEDKVCFIMNLMGADCDTRQFAVELPDESLMPHNGLFRKMRPNPTQRRE